MLQIRLNTFHVREKTPNISFITPNDLKKFGTFQTDVTVGLYINQFENFNMVNNTFVFTGVLWFKFNPGTISIDVIEDFSFELGEILERAEADTQLIDDKLLVQYAVRVRFNSLLDYADFPLDDHRLYIVLTNRFLSPEEILFNSSQREFIVKPDVTTFGWKQVDRYVLTGYRITELDEYDVKKTFYYPTVIFAIDYARYGARFSLSIFLPLLLIFYLTLFTFSLRSPRAIFSLATGGVTATLAYRFVIENLSPSVGYFMVSDAIFLLLLVLDYVSLIIIKP